MPAIDPWLDRAPDFDQEEEMSEEQVNHPKYYNSHPSGVEAIDLCEHTNFNIGDAWKYLFRAGHKKDAPAELDRQKAMWYLRRDAARNRGSNFPINSVIDMSLGDWKVFESKIRHVFDSAPMTALGLVLAAYLGSMGKAIAGVQPFSYVIDQMIDALEWYEKNNS